MLSLFSANLLPILITAGLGYLLSLLIDIKPQTISRVTFYLFSPCLAFQLLSKSELDSNAIALIVVFAVTSSVVVAILAFLVTKIFKFERKISVAIIITSFLTNAGNFGLSFNKFAFGDQALAYASIFFVVSSIMIYTLGVAVASMGQANIKESLLNLLKFPALYAVALAMLFNYLNWELPLPLDRATQQLGEGAIPAMLVLLGMQLKNAKIAGNTGPIAVATVIRLVAAPIIAISLSRLFNLQGAALQAGVSEASMPTAVMTTILATEFDAEPGIVSAIVAVTTILSPLTLTPLLVYLGSI